MTPYYADDWLTIYEGDCRTVLAELPADSVDCVVTSPPYWGLRDYGNDGQLGLERTPEEYVANIVAVFAEVRRVLKPSGTCWLNLGDSYVSGGERGTAGRGATSSLGKDRFGDRFDPALQTIMRSQSRAGAVGGLKPKDLVGIPWRVAFALQADGWYLRSDIIWSKPNPMPESVTDRPTKSHEYLFLLTKSARYYFDADAVRETMLPASIERYGYDFGGAKAERLTAEEGNGAGTRTHPIGARTPGAGRNIRSVWTIATRPYPGAHFAVFPPELPERCIKAGSSERGVCPECGAPWERVVERVPRDYGMGTADTSSHKAVAANGNAKKVLRSPTGHTLSKVDPVTTGWRPACEPRLDPRLEKHLIHPVPAVVLDPFAGSGTVGLVANRLSRRAILIDLNPEYLKQQMKRNAQTPLGLGAV